MYVEWSRGGRKQNKDRCQRAVVMPELIRSATRLFPAFEQGWGVEFLEIAPVWPVVLMSDRCRRGQRRQSAVLLMVPWVTRSPPDGGDEDRGGFRTPLINYVLERIL